MAVFLLLVGVTRLTGRPGLVFGLALVLLLLVLVLVDFDLVAVLSGFVQPDGPLNTCDTVRSVLLLLLALVAELLELELVDLLV